MMPSLNKMPSRWSSRDAPCAKSVGTWGAPPGRSTAGSPTSKTAALSRDAATTNQMPGIAAVDALEVPRARDDFRVRFPRARSRLQQDKRFHIDLAAAENLPFLRQWIGRNPHAVLQVAEAFVAQVASQPFALGVLSRGHVEEQHDSIFTKGPSDVLDHATSEIASGSKLGIDATKKLPGEGFKRAWPPLIKMDKQVQEKITALFGGKT